MDQYVVEINQLHFNQVTETFEKGLILGASQFQYGDRFFSAKTAVKDALAEGWVKRVPAEGL